MSTEQEMSAVQQSSVVEDHAGPGRDIFALVCKGSSIVMYATPVKDNRVFFWPNHSCRPVGRLRKLRACTLFNTQICEALPFAFCYAKTRSHSL